MNYSTRQTYTLTASGDGPRALDSRLVLRDLVLHIALYVFIETPCVRLSVHLLIRAIVRLVIVFRCCRMLLEIRVHRYLDPTI